MPPAIPPTGPVRRRFQAGGTVGEGAFYVERPADRELPDALRRGELCFVLATRQIGKSSLRLRAAKQLTAEGVACVHVDLTALGTETSTPETWYFGLTSEIADQLALAPPDGFWDAHKRLGPVHAWSRYLSDEVLGGIGGRKVVIFLDEIDAMLSLPFSRDDFFAAVRALHNRRAERPERGSLTFCLMGVAAPGDLIADPARTPFNIGRPIRLEDFGGGEARVLREGLEGLGPDPDALLDEVLGWTSGHPYMTLRLCEDMAEAQPGTGVEEAVRARFLARGRTEDANLQYAARWFEQARERAVSSKVPRMLRLYQRLLAEEGVTVEEIDSVQFALRLTGMAAERDGAGGRVLKVRNRIFSTVFDLVWVRKKEADRRIVEPVRKWLEGEREEDFLLSGAALAEVRAWAQGREDLTAEEREFLEACVRGEERRLYREVESVNRVKDEFLATLSHELRTPLNAVLGWARLLRLGKLDENARVRALDTIERNASAQAQLIEDLLDVSRIISGKFQVEARVVDLARITEAALDAVHLAADAKSIELVARLLPVPRITGDPTRLQQVVWNLLSNAIKFTPRGGRVEVRLGSVDSQVQLEVADTGEGIRADFLPYVFERFRQAGGAITRQHSGLGLGLAIVRHLVEIHGGQVRAHSEGEGRGPSLPSASPSPPCSPRE